MLKKTHKTYFEENKYQELLDGCVNLQIHYTDVSFELFQFLRKISLEITLLK